MYISLIKDLLLVSNSKILLKFQRKILLKSKVSYKKSEHECSHLTVDRTNLFCMFQVSCQNLSEQWPWSGLFSFVSSWTSFLGVGKIPQMEDWCPKMQILLPLVLYHSAEVKRLQRQYIIYQQMLLKAGICSRGKMVLVRVAYFSPLSRIQFSFPMN